MTDNTIRPVAASGGGFSGKQVIGMILASIFIAILVTVLTLKIFLFPSPFKPVVLSPKEEQLLSTKLEKLDDFTAQPEKAADEFSRDGTLKPESYSEKGSSREISFTEREINAMMARNTDLAEKLAIDLSDNTISIKLLIPLDPDFPVMGGKTLKVNAGAELAYKNGRPVVKLKGVSLMGVPIPNSWLGGLKNIDLIHEFGGNNGFWKTFADGVDAISVTDGFLKIKLKE
jgi:hypothetical protein